MGGLSGAGHLPQVSVRDVGLRSNQEEPQRPGRGGAGRGGQAGGSGDARDQHEGEVIILKQFVISGEFCVIILYQFSHFRRVLIIILNQLFCVSPYSYSSYTSSCISCIGSITSRAM